MTPISDHFTLEEVTASQLASRQGIDNSLPPELLPAVKFTARQMERVRGLLGSAIHVNSWYRCPLLNTQLGSKNTSQHLRGEAVDFVAPAAGSSLEICKKILQYPELIRFDQLILEHTWVHISFSANPTVANRNQVLSLLQNGTYSSGLTDSSGRHL